MKPDVAPPEHERLAAELDKARAALARSHKLAALGQISAGLAHELNNPLSIIHGYVELMKPLLRRGAPPSEEVWRYLGRIEVSVDRMATLIRNVREFSREPPPQRAPLSLAAPIRAAVGLLDDALRLQNIRTELVFGGEELVVAGDETQLEQVFLTLLANARDAIRDAQKPEGGTVRIRVLAVDTAVVAEVDDDGVGMIEEVRRRMFEPFFTTKPASERAGLGLSIAYGIIEEHEGSMRATSTPGRGTSVEIRLPKLPPAAG